jgi:hypothetical protein
MTDPFEDGLSGAREKVEQFSNKVLRPYLKIHIFGPYEGDCENYLRKVTLGLQEHGYEKTAICSDIEGRPPESACRKEKARYWKQKSYDFLEFSDVAVFFFLKNTLDRSETLPEDAFDNDKFVDNLPDDEEPIDIEREVQDLNASPIQELNHWFKELDGEPERSMALFESGCHDRIGPIFAAEVDSAKMYVEDELPDHDVETAIRRVNGAAKEWVNKHCKRLLQERYYRDQIE